MVGTILGFRCFISLYRSKSVGGSLSGSMTAVVSVTAGHCDLVFRSVLIGCLGAMSLFG